MNKQHKLLSFVVSMCAPECVMPTVALVSRYFTSEKHLLPDSVALRSRLATLLGKLTHVPTERIRIEAVTCDKYVSGNQIRNVQEKLKLGRKTHYEITSRHLEALTDKSSRSTVEFVHDLVWDAVTEAFDGDVNEIEQANEIAVLTLLVVAATIGHRGAFAFAQELAALLHQVDILGKDADGTWIVVTHYEKA